MPLRQHKRKEAHALSRELKRRFYKGAAIATLVYVVLSLVKFHGEFVHLPYELAITWAVFLICYASLKEVLRWSDVEDDVEDEEIYQGELWAGIILAGAAWMILWNIGRTWIFHLSPNHFPDDYEASTIETIVLYTLSVISSFLYKYNGIQRRPVRRKPRAVAAREELRPSAMVAKSGPANTTPGQNQNQEVVLTKSPPPDDKKPLNS